MDIREFVGTGAYDTVLRDVTRRLDTRVNESVPDVMWRLADEPVTQSGFSYDQVHDLLTSHGGHVAEFATAVILRYRDDVDGDDEDPHIQHPPQYRPFLAPSIALFAVIQNDRGAVEAYVKSRKIRPAKAYAKEVTEIFDRVTNATD